MKGMRSLAVLAAVLSLTLGSSSALGEGLDERPTPLSHGIGPFRRVIRSIALWDGALWFGTYGSGLFRVDEESGKVSQLTAATSGLAEDRVNGLEVHGGKLWVASCAGIQELGPEGFGRHHRAGPDSVSHDIYHALDSMPSGGIWAGTTGYGISRFHEGRWETWHTPQGLTEGWVNAQVETPDGTAWVATGRGLFSGSPGAFRRTRTKGRAPPYDAELTALAVQGEFLWVGTAQDGLHGMRDGFFFRVPTESLPSPQVLALATTRDGTLWVGTRKGLARYRLEEGFREAGPDFPPAREEIKVLEALPDGRLLAGTFAGKVFEVRSGSGFRLVCALDDVLGPAPPAGAGK